MIPRFLLVAALLATGGVEAKTVLDATADAYVSNGSANTNYGTATTVVAHNTEGVRISYLRFDLSGITGPITRAALDLTSAGKGVDSFNVYGVTNGDNWQESVISWNNAPGILNGYLSPSGTLSQILNPGALFRSGTPLASFSAPGAIGSHNRAADVTYGPLLDFIGEDPDKIVTFLIVEQDPVDPIAAADAPSLTWHSNEAPNAAFRPKLTLYRENETWPTIRVVLLGGQSNADGRAAGSDLPADYQPPQDNIPFYRYIFNSAGNADGSFGQLTTLRPGATQTPVGGFGPEVALGRLLAPHIEAIPRSQLAIIKYARGGTNLHIQWKAGGDGTATADGPEYERWQRVMRNGISKIGAANPDARIDLAAMVWVQGESDITVNADAAPAYEQNLRAFIDDVRQTIRPHLPFFFSRLSDGQTDLRDTPAKDERYLQVRAAQEAVAASVPGTYLLDSDGAAYPMKSDHLHYNGAGQIKLGSEFAKMIANRVILRHGLTKAASSPAVVNWNAVPGRTYYLDRSEDLKTWQRTAIGAVSAWMDTEAPGTRFYRVAEAD